MKYSKQIFVLFLVVTFTYSCKKNTNNPECATDATVVYEDDCIPIPPPPDFIIQWPYLVPAEIKNLSADVNPENHEQFCVLQKLSSGIERIIIYDKSTNQTDVLVEGDFDVDICWMVDNWIVYHEEDSFQMLRTKSDGSQTEQILPIATGLAKRNHDHSLLLCRAYSTTYIIEGASIIDSLDYSFDYESHWDHPDGAILHSETHSIEVRQTLSEDAEIYQIESEASIGDVLWCDNYTKFIWASRDGWFKTDPNTLESAKLRENCDAKFYKFQANVDDDILVTCFYKEPYLGDSLLSTARIGLVKCDGSSIELFDIPE